MYTLLEIEYNKNEHLRKYICYQYFFRDYCTSGRHVVSMCMNVIKVSVYLQVQKFSFISLPIFTLFIEGKTFVILMLIRKRWR